MIEGEGCSPEKNLNVQGINGRSQIKSGFSGEYVYHSAQDSWQVLVFEGKTGSCSLSVVR
jgi:hypothetical protein